MTGIRAVQAYRREPRNAEIFSGVAHRYQDANVKSFRLVAIFMPGVRLVGNVTIGIVLLYGGWRVMQGEMTIGVLTAFLLYLRMFFEPMQEISQFYNTFQSASAALEKLSGVLEEDPTVREPRAPGAAAARARHDPVRRRPFSYVPERTVLPGLDLCMPAGPDGGPGGHHRSRQDDDREADVAVLRPDRRSRCCSTGSTCAS